MCLTIEILLYKNMKYATGKKQRAEIYFVDEVPIHKINKCHNSEKD